MSCGFSPGLDFRRLWCLSFTLVIVNLVLVVWWLVFGGFCCNADSGLLAGCGFSSGLGWDADFARLVVGFL